jgi:hypothetical protein
VSLQVKGKMVVLLYKFTVKYEYVHSKYLSSFNLFFVQLASGWEQIIVRFVFCIKKPSNQFEFIKKLNCVNQIFWFGCLVFNFLKYFFFVNFNFLLFIENNNWKKKKNFDC